MKARPGGSSKVPRDVARNLYRRDVWITEVWPELVLVLGVAWGIAALLGLSCVAMAGIDEGDRPVERANKAADMMERAEAR
jgi:hypothetical protein